VDIITWTYIAIMCGALIVITLLALPRWRKLTRSRNQWSNIFVYAAKVGITIYMLADPRQGKILSATAFVGILSNVHDIMETWWEFRRDPSSLYLHISGRAYLTQKEIELKCKFERVTERLGLVSYGVLVACVIGLVLSHNIEDSTVGELWFMWIGFLCAMAEIVVEDDIYKIELEHAAPGSEEAVAIRTRLKKVRQRIYCISLFIASVLGTAISLEIHELASNIIIIGITGFQRWIKIQVTNALARSLPIRRSLV
jgi:hypothetical protein